MSPVRTDRRPNYLTVENMCHELNISRVTLYKLIREKKVPTPSRGRRTWYGRRRLVWSTYEIFDRWLPEQNHILLMHEMRCSELEERKRRERRKDIRSKVVTSAVILTLVSLAVYLLFFSSYEDETMLVIGLILTIVGIGLGLSSIPAKRGFKYIGPETEREGSIGMVLVIIGIILMVLSGLS